MNCLNKETRAEIRKMISAGSFRTDSDVDQYAEERKLSVRDVEQVIWEIISENTPCRGCKHVTLMTTGLYPCNSCSRRAKDLYERAE